MSRLLEGNHVWCGYGVKKPGCANVLAIIALAQRWPAASGKLVGGYSTVGAVISSQKLRKRCTRSFGALPAKIAALIAPIEIPATQSGRYSEDVSASKTPA